MHTTCQCMIVWLLEYDHLRIVVDPNHPFKHEYRKAIPTRFRYIIPTYTTPRSHMCIYPLTRT